jgi:hypothetical protein
MGLRKETGSLEQIRQGSTGLVEIRFGQWGTRDQQQIGPVGCLRDKIVHCRSQQALGPVAFNGIPDRQSSAHPHTYACLVRFQYIQYNKRVGIGFARTTHPLEIG